MTVSWPDARAALAAHLDARSITVSGHAAETLDALEFPPGGRQDVGEWPYCFVMPNGQEINRASGMRRTQKDAVVRVMLAPRGESLSMESISQRYEAWKADLTDAMDSAISIDGTATVFNRQSFGDLSLYDDVDSGWGFEMTLGSLEIVESKSFSA